MHPTKTEFRDVKQIITVPSPNGATQIFTVTKKSSMWKLKAGSVSAQIVAPVGPIQPGAGVSLLKKKPMIARSVKSKMVPNILRTGPKRSCAFLRSQNLDSRKPAATAVQASNTSRNITATVQYASTSNQPFLAKLNKRNAQCEIINPYPQSHNEELLPLEPEIELRIKDELEEEEQEEREAADDEQGPDEPFPIESSIMAESSTDCSKSINVNPAFVVESTARHRSTAEESSHEESAFSQMPSPNASCVTESLTKRSFLKASPVRDDYNDPETDPASQSVDDVLNDMVGNICQEPESFYMVSHESLMEALSSCRLCGAASEVTLVRRGTTCQAHIQCRKSLNHSVYWIGEKCRSLGHYQHDVRASESKTLPTSDSVLPRYDIPWSLILVSLVAKIVGIPLRKIELLLQSIFTRTCLEKTLDMASSFVSSFEMLHGLTDPKLTQPVDHVKVFVVCRKLLVFLDPSTLHPLSCFEAPGGVLWTMSDFSSALNIGLQRLQLLNSTKFSTVKVLQSNHESGQLSEWKPVLVPDMVLLFQNILKELNAALWRNDLKIDSMNLGEILAEVTRALCFFTPNIARMSKDEGRDHLSLLLSDLLEIHRRQYVPKISELALLRKDLNALSCKKSPKKVNHVLGALNRLDVHSIVCSVYEQIISTADASYVVSVCSEQPNKQTYEVMTMVDLCQTEDLTLENALRVILLLPLPKAPVSVIEEMYASYESGL